LQIMCETFEILLLTLLQKKMNFLHVISCVV
jgi:hypothetical protein